MSIVLATSGCEDIGTEPGGPEGLRLLGLKGMQVVSLRYDAPYLYSCTAQNGVWRWDGRAMHTWQYLGLGDSSLGHYSDVGALDIDVLGDTLLVAYNGYGANPSRSGQTLVAIWRSTDRGQSWHAGDRGIPETLIPLEGNVITSVRRSPHVPGVVIGAFGTTLYRSTDGGNWWQLIYGRRGVFLNEGIVRWNSHRPGEVWDAGMTSIFSPFTLCMSQYGSSFKLSVDYNALGFGTDGTVADIAFDANDADRIYAATSYGPISSTDGGYHWEARKMILPDSGSVSALLSHPSLPLALFLAGTSAYYSSDGGATIRVIGQIPDQYIFCIQFDPSSSRLFLGSSSGVYEMPFSGG